MISDSTALLSLRCSPSSFSFLFLLFGFDRVELFICRLIASLKSLVLSGAFDATAGGERRKVVD
jgi:hypothetical protein